MKKKKKKNREQSKKFFLYKVQISFAVRPDCSHAVKKIKRGKRTSTFFARRFARVQRGEKRGGGGRKKKKKEKTTGRARSLRQNASTRARFPAIYRYSRHVNGIKFPAVGNKECLNENRHSAFLEGGGA